VSKVIRAFRLSTPDVEGFPDKVQILNGDTGNMLIFESTVFRTNPNPYQPVNPAIGHLVQRPWSEVYAQIAPTGPDGIPWQCVTTPKHGKCIALNGEGPVPTTGPDPNNNEQMFALAVLIHESSTVNWSGSMACQTVQKGDGPMQWTSFIGHFELGENGIFILTDDTD
jgi:hypothetical protein